MNDSSAMLVLSEVKGKKVMLSPRRLDVHTPLPEKGVSLCAYVRVCSLTNGSHKAEDNEDQDLKGDVYIDGPFQLASLDARPTVIQHRLGLVPYDPMMIRR